LKEATCFVALRSPRSNVSVSTPPLVDFRAPRIWTFLNSLESEFFNSLLQCDKSTDETRLMMARPLRSEFSTRFIIWPAVAMHDKKSILANSERKAEAGENS
jgi:hypothetical protein